MFLVHSFGATRARLLVILIPSSIFSGIDQTHLEHCSAHAFVQLSVFEFLNLPEHMFSKHVFYSPGFTLNHSGGSRVKNNGSRDIDISVSPENREN